MKTLVVHVYEEGETPKLDERRGDLVRVKDESMRERVQELAKERDEANLLLHAILLGIGKPIGVWDKVLELVGSPDYVGVLKHEKDPLDGLTYYSVVLTDEEKARL